LIRGPLGNFTVGVSERVQQMVGGKHSHQFLISRKKGHLVPFSSNYPQKRAIFRKKGRFSAKKGDFLLAIETASHYQFKR